MFGIGGPHRLFLPETTEALAPLIEKIPFRYEIVEASHLGGEVYKGTLTKLSLKAAEARLENPVPTLTNLKMHLTGTLYAKVVGTVAGSSTDFSFRFTSVSPEVETFLRVLLAQRAGGESKPSEPMSLEVR